MFYSGLTYGTLENKKFIMQHISFFLLNVHFMPW